MFLNVLEFELKFEHFYVARSTILGMGQVPQQLFDFGCADYETVSRFASRM